MKFPFLFIITVLSAAFSQLIFKGFALKKLTGIDLQLANIIVIFEKIIKDPLMIFGIFLYGVGFLLWLYLLSKAKLNIIYPLSAASIILVVVIGSRFIYQEYLSLIQLSGIGLVVLGLFLLWQV